MKKVFVLNPLYYALFSLTLMPQIGWAEDEFDAGFLRQGDNNPTVDIHRFNQKNAVLAGDYPADIFVNEVNKGHTQLHFEEVGEHVELCLTPELAEMLDLQANAFLTSPSDSDCVPLNGALSQASVVFDTGILRLNVAIPQALTVQRPRDYIAPSRWQEGNNALFVNYNANHYRYHRLEGQSQQSYLGIRAGANLGGWALRHSGAKNWESGEGRTKSRYESTETYLQKDFNAIRGLVTLGDFYTSGELMEGFSLRGVKVASDDRMLPPSQRGYAPVIQGVANSNANVTIRQNGTIIYQTTVPAGPFTISDLYPSGYSGDLLVEITESNGQTRRFTVPFASVAPLVRMGQFRYQAAYGRYRSNSEMYPDKVLQATMQYGLLNNLTLNGGVTYHENYRAGLFGVGLNTPIGAFATDATVAQTHFDYLKEKKNGYSLHASYSVNVLSTNTNLTLAAYRYYSKDFYSLRDVIWARNNDIASRDEMLQDAFLSRPKNQYQLSINQNLGDKWGTLYLTGSTYNYWGQRGTRNEYQFSYSNNWKKLSYQIGFSQSIDNDANLRDNSVYLSFSLPLGENYLSSTVTRSRNYSSAQSTFSGSLGQYSQFNYGVSASVGSEQNRSISANAGYRADMGDYQFSIGQDNQHNRQISASADGSIVAHRHGVTLGNTVGDSFAIIHANDAKGALVTATGTGQRLDYFGNAIVPYTTPYTLNYIGIDPTDLPVNIEFDSTEQQIVPRANSINVVNLGAQKTTMVLFNVAMKNNVVLPIGAEAKDEQGRVVGYVGQGGVLFANNLNQANGTLSVTWGNDQHEQCRFEYQVKLDNKADEMQFYNVECK